MKTPAGKECSFFFGDYYRGRDREECRLLTDHDLQWKPNLCLTCRMPGIQQANGCENMIFTPTLFRPLLILKQQVRLDAFCKKNNVKVDVPEIGCGDCVPLLDFIMVEKNENDPSD